MEKNMDRNMLFRVENHTLPDIYYATLLAGNCYQKVGGLYY